MEELNHIKQEILEEFDQSLNQDENDGVLENSLLDVKQKLLDVKQEQEQEHEQEKEQTQLHEQMQEQAPTFEQEQTQGQEQEEVVPIGGGGKSCTKMQTYKKKNLKKKENVTGKGGGPATSTSLPRPATSLDPSPVLPAKRGRVSTRTSKISPLISSPPPTKRVRTKVGDVSEPRKKNLHDKTGKGKEKVKEGGEAQKEQEESEEQKEGEGKEESDSGEDEDEDEQDDFDDDHGEAEEQAQGLSDVIVEFVKDDLPPIPLPTYLDDNLYFDNKLITVRSSIGKGFAEFKSLLRQVKLYDRFEESCFGHFLQMPASLFCPKVVHNLLLRRVLCKKKHELWFNFYGLPLRFGLFEFCLMTKLKCHVAPSNEYIEQVKERAKEFRDEVTSNGKYKASGINLLDFIKNPEIKNMDQKFGVCLLYFYTRVLHGKDSSTSAGDLALSLAAFPDEFERYPWGRDVYELTFSYLSKSFQERKNPQNSYTLYGFPFAFLAWAYEAIPGLRRLHKQPGVKTVPRMFRWMVQLSDENAKHIFERLEAPIEVRPVLVPTPLESATVVDGFVPYDDVEDEVVDRLMAQLVGVSMLRKGADVASTSEAAEVERVVFVERVETACGGFDEVKCTCQCGHCKKFKVDIWQKLVSIEEVLKTFMLRSTAEQRMSVEFESFMLERKEEGTSLFQGKLYSYRDLDELMRMEVVMNDKHVDDVMSLMRLRHKEHKQVFLESDLILDLNFSTELYDIYQSLVARATLLGVPIEQIAKAIDVEFKKLTPYAIGYQPYPGGRNWVGVKRVFTVHKLKEGHYVTVVYMVDNANVMVYDSMPNRSNDELATLAMAATMVFPRFFKKCVLLEQLGDGSMMNDSWTYELVQDAPTNNTGTATGGFSLACIDHLVTSTPLDSLCDNTMIDYRDKWARAIFHGKLAL